MATIGRKHTAGEKHTASPLEVPAIGARIRTLREGMKISVSQLARQLGVSRNTITNYESGKTEPSANMLMKLAYILGCRLEELLGVEPPPAPARFLFRAHAGLRTKPNLRTVAQRFLRAHQEVEEITGIQIPDRLAPYVRQESGPISPGEIESRAEELRHKCLTYDTGPENIVNVLESWGIRCVFYPLELEGFDALSAIQGERRLILLNDSNKNVERIIFSAVHEFAHFVLHPTLFTPDPAKAEETKPLATDPEKEADAFAGYFLVPTAELRRIWWERQLNRLPVYYALLQLKKIFRVSYFCLFYRLQTLGLVNMEYGDFIQHTKKHLGFVGPAKLKHLEPEPFEYPGIYRITRFYLLVQSAFVQGLVGVTKVAEWLQIPVEKAKEETAKWRQELFQMDQ